MSRTLADRARILDALGAAGIRTATTGKLSAPVVLVEPGDPWTEPRRLPGRLSSWKLTAYAGKADPEGSLGELAELVDRIDSALRTIGGCELPSWGMPADLTGSGVPYGAMVATIQIQSM